MLAEARHVETITNMNRTFRYKATQTTRMVIVRMAQNDPRHTIEVNAKLRRIWPKRRARSRVEQNAFVPVLDQQRQSMFGDKALRRPVVNDVRNPQFHSPHASAQ